MSFKRVINKPIKLPNNRWNLRNQKKILTHLVTLSNLFQVTKTGFIFSQKFLFSYVRFVFIFSKHKKNLYRKSLPSSGNFHSSGNEDDDDDNETLTNTKYSVTNCSSVGRSVCRLIEQNAMENSRLCSYLYPSNACKCTVRFFFSFCLTRNIFMK